MRPVDAASAASSPAHSPRSPSAPSKEARTIQLRVRTSCCDFGYDGLRVEVGSYISEARASGETDSQGEALLRLVDCGEEEEFRLRVDGITPSLLPGGTNQYNAYLHDDQVVRIEVDVSCLLWVYWLEPEEPYSEDFEAEDEEGSPVRSQELAEGTLWICTAEELVPDEALPVHGTLLCPGAEQQRIHLDGTSLGPIMLRPAPATGGDGGMAPETQNACSQRLCMLAGLQIDPQPPKGYGFRYREPSPLVERCQEIGGCELQRLLACPCALGYFPVLRED